MGNVEVRLTQGITKEDQYVIENNPYRYRGYYYDKESGLYYCSSRYYSPELCIFTSIDSIEYLDCESINGLDLYCYCLNNPIMYVDPSGHFILSSVLISIGLSLAFELIEDLVGDGKIGGDKDIWDYLGAGVAGFFDVLVVA